MKTIYFKIFNDLLGAKRRDVHGDKNFNKTAHKQQRGDIKKGGE